MKRYVGRLAALAIWGAGLGLAVWSYNLWTFSCSGCAVPSAFPLGLPAYGFLGLIGAALLILIILKWRRKASIARSRCDCGTLRDKAWNYCPSCGLSRTP